MEIHIHASLGVSTAYVDAKVKVVRQHARKCNVGNGKSRGGGYVGTFSGGQKYASDERMAIRHVRTSNCTPYIWP